MKVFPVDVSVSLKKAVVAPMATADTTAITDKLITIFFIIFLILIRLN
jgi:hypothetical protein